jgi:hypothetical protein
MARGSKIILFMLIGSVAMAFGAMVAGNVGVGTRLSPTTFFTSIVISVILFFIGGVFWMIVAKSLNRN